MLGNGMSRKMTEDVRRVLEDGTEGEEERNGQEVKWRRRRRRSERRNEVGRFLITLE